MVPVASQIALAAQVAPQGNVGPVRVAVLTEAVPWWEVAAGALLVGGVVGALFVAVRRM